MSQIHLVLRLTKWGRYVLMIYHVAASVLFQTRTGWSQLPFCQDMWQINMDDLFLLPSSQ